jgi:hypothetical protein
MKRTDLLTLLAVSIILACIPLAAADNAATLPAEPGSQKGYFYINSIPPGADVYFDSTYAGETPVTVAVSTTGTPSHSISISLPGYELWTTTINENPRAGQTITVTATLSSSSSVGQIQVTSNPSGATAVLDRSQSKITPAYFTSIPVGSHEISVSLAGYQTQYTSVNVQKGQTASINILFSPPVSQGTLSISSNPSGAAVYVDGIYRGLTPTTIGNLAPGQHVVLLSKAGYQDWQGYANIQGGVITTLSPTLVSDPSPIYGTVSIISTPSGASVYADGIYVGQTSPNRALVFTQVKPGNHELLLSKTGYQDYKTSGTVYAGQDLSLTISLTPNPQTPDTGSISIVSSPSGAEAYLDNVYRGMSPLTLDAVTPGTHSVLLRLDGYQDWQSQVSVTAGQTTQISATLLGTPTPTPTQSGIAPLAILGALGLFVVVLRKKP